MIDCESTHPRLWDPLPDPRVFPLRSITPIFAAVERLILEINQAGLSWITILKKADNFRLAYSRFDIDSVAAYGATDQARLLSDAGIIRNRLKVNAAVENALRIQDLRNEHGSFKGWLDSHHPQTLENWTKLFKRNFFLQVATSSMNS